MAILGDTIKRLKRYQKIILAIYHLTNYAMEKEIKKTLISYLEGRTAYWLLEDKVTEYLENKKLDNVKLKKDMICNDLWGAKFLIDNWHISQWVKQYEFVKNYVLAY